MCTCAARSFETCFPGYSRAHGAVCRPVPVPWPHPHGLSVLGGERVHHQTSPTPAPDTPPPRPLFVSVSLVFLDSTQGEVMRYLFLRLAYLTEHQALWAHPCSHKQQASPWAAPGPFHRVGPAPSVPSRLSLGTRWLCCSEHGWAQASLQDGAPGFPSLGENPEVGVLVCFSLSEGPPHFRRGPMVLVRVSLAVETSSPHLSGGLAAGPTLPGHCVSTACHTHGPCSGSATSLPLHVGRVGPGQCPWSA